MAERSKQDRSEQSREAILNAASTLFLDGGIGAMSVRAIAQRARVSTIGIYSHFNGKQGIIDTLYVQGFNKLSAAMDVDDSLSTSERLLAATQQYLDLGEQFEAHYRLIFGEVDAGYNPSEEARTVQIAAFNKLVELSTRLLADAQSNEEPRQFALEIWALLHGFVSLRHHTAQRAMPNNSPHSAVRGRDNLEQPGEWRAAAIRAVRRLAESYGLN